MTTHPPTHALTTIRLDTLFSMTLSIATPSILTTPTHHPTGHLTLLTTPTHHPTGHLILHDPLWEVHCVSHSQHHKMRRLPTGPVQEMIQHLLLLGREHVQLISQEDSGVTPSLATEEGLKLGTGTIGCCFLSRQLLKSDISGEL